MAPFPPWTDLPQELLSAIANLLNPNPIDILRFRAVCKSWFSSSLSLPSSILSPLLPLTLPRPPYPFRAYCCKSGPESSVLSATTVYALRPPSGSPLGSAPSTWVLFVDQSNPNGKLRTHRHFIRYYFSLPLDFPRKLNLLDFRVSEIGRFYNLTHASMLRFLSGETLKVIFMSNLSVVIALSDKGSLMLMRLGKGKHALTCAEWEIIHDGKGFCFDDIVEYKGRPLGIDRRGRVYEMYHDFSEMNVIVRPINCGGRRRKRLVESRGILHLVVRCDVKGKPEQLGNIKVYQLNEKTRRWDEVKNIGDQLFLFGTSFSLSVSTRVFKDFCGKNCIMFEEYSFKKYPLHYWHCSESWLFDKLGVGALKVAVYHLEDNSCIRALESYPCYSDIFWPPPPWIWLSDKEKIIGTLETVIVRLLRGIHDETLKAKFKEFSSLVGALVSMEDGSQISKPQMVTITKETDILNRFMNEIDLEIEKQSNSIQKEVLKEDAWRQKQRNLTQLPNQIGTLEDIRGCVHFVQKATHSCTGGCDACEWLRPEVRRRLGTLIRLSELLKVVNKVLQKFTDLKAGLESHEQPLLSSSFSSPR